MITVSVQDSVSPALAQAVEQITPAILAGINHTAFQVRDALQQEMMRVFDQPTPWALSTVWVDRATPENPVATVGPNDYFSQSLISPIVNEGQTITRVGPWETVFSPNIVGGDRPLKRTEERLQRIGAMPMGWYAIPSEQAPHDEYGNLRHGEMTKILSWLQALEIGNRPHRYGWSKRSRKGSVARAGGCYFVSLPGGDIRLPYGVWHRDASGKLTPILYFQSSVQYRPIFDFFGVGQRVIDAELDRNIQYAIDQLSVTL